MNARKFILAATLSIVHVLAAEEPPAQFDTSAPKKRFEWVAPKGGQTLPKPAGVRLGKSDYVASGPLIDTFRLSPPRDTGERTLGQKILNLPILNIFVPEPMPKPTGTGKYFAWGEHDKPWSVIADRPIPGPQSTLVSVSR